MGERGSVQASDVASRQHLARHPTVFKLPSVAPAAPLQVPKAPAGFKTEGRTLWATVWRACHHLDPAKDRQLVTELCRLADQMTEYRAALAKHGALIEEVIVSPRGEVVGNRQVANPASTQLKNALAATERLWSAIGLSPQARARLPR